MMLLRMRDSICLDMDTGEVHLNVNADRHGQKRGKEPQKVKDVDMHPLWK